MRFTSGISDALNPQAAAETASRQVLEQLQGHPCHLACVFFSTSYRADWPAILTAVHARLAPHVLIGCSASGIIGGSRELEWVPAISIVGAHLPEVRLFPFALTPDELDGSAAGEFWTQKIGVSPEAHPIFVVFADPLTCDASKLLDEVNETFPERPVVGGLVSGGNKPGEHLVVLDTDVYQEGAVGVAMTGNIAMDTIVSQGCRPVGRPYVVTKAEENIIWQLAGREAVAVLHEVLAGLSQKDRELAQQGALFIGLVLDEMRHGFAAGDFLIRNLVGLDPQAGGLAISDRVHVGQTIQFHLRDASTAREELRRLLGQQERPAQAQPTAGGLLFTCLGRGQSLYGMPHHDTQLIQRLRAEVPIGGFFCNGEIGPVGRANFLHGYTASLGLFRPLKASPSA